MRLKQLAIALLCSGALAAPALAQTTTTVPRTTAPTMTPAIPNGNATNPTPTTSATGGTSMGTATTSSMPAAGMAGSKSAMAPAGMMTMTNINTASATDLDKLPQIGKARAKKIIDNRPYKSTDELVSKKVLSQPVFNKIKDKISAS